MDLEEQYLLTMELYFLELLRQGQEGDRGEQLSELATVLEIYSKGLFAFYDIYSGLIWTRAREFSLYSIETKYLSAIYLFKIQNFIEPNPLNYPSPFPSLPFYIYII